MIFQSYRDVAHYEIRSLAPNGICENEFVPVTETD
jgi:hypothetical protein